MPARLRVLVDLLFEPVEQVSGECSSVFRRKLESFLEQVVCVYRGGRLIVITDEPDDSFDEIEHRLIVPHAAYYLMPIVLTIPLKLIAYYMAVHRGADVDQPRNLAKSVTVE